MEPLRSDRKIYFAGELKLTAINRKTEKYCQGSLFGKVDDLKQSSWFAGPIEGVPNTKQLLRLVTAMLKRYPGGLKLGRR